MVFLEKDWVLFAKALKYFYVFVMMEYIGANQVELFERNRVGVKGADGSGFAHKSTPVWDAKQLFQHELAISQN